MECPDVLGMFKKELKECQTGDNKGLFAVRRAFAKGLYITIACDFTEGQIIELMEEEEAAGAVTYDSTLSRDTEKDSKKTGDILKRLYMPTQTLHILTGMRFVPRDDMTAKTPQKNENMERLLMNYHHRHIVGNGFSHA